MTAAVLYALATLLAVFGVIGIYRSLRLEARGRLVDADGNDQSGVFFVYYAALGLAVYCTFVGRSL